MLHPENLKNVKKLLEEVSRYAEGLGTHEINAVLTWFEHHWPNYLVRRSQVESQERTKEILQARGFGCPPMDKVPDWKIGISPAALDFPAARITRILTAARRAEILGLTNMEHAVDHIALAMTGEGKSIDTLAELEILSCPEDWKRIYPWTDNAAMAVLETIEDFFKPPRK